MDNSIDYGRKYRDNVVFYTYTKNNPSVADCIFYGNVNGVVKPIKYGDVKARRNYIVSAKSNTIGQEIKIPSEFLENGMRIGFVYSVNLGPHFTTPSLNVKESGAFSDAYSDYIGQTILGDFDFNDVIIAYDIIRTGGLMEAKCKVVASGCNNHNEVGLMVLPNTNNDAWKTPDYKKVLICGYFNVYTTEKLDFKSEHYLIMTIRFTCSDFQKLRPYLKNSNGSFFTYNTGDYPYALDIPSYLDESYSENKNKQKNTCFLLAFGRSVY